MSDPLVRISQNRGDPGEGPVDLSFGDYERRGETEYVVVRFLAQDAALHQPLAEAPGTLCIGVKFHSDHQPDPADLFHIRALDPAEALQEILSRACRILDNALVPQDSQSSPGNGAGERIAAECASVVAGVKHPQYFCVRKHRRDGIKATGERFPDQGSVGLDPFVLLGQKLSPAIRIYPVAGSMRSVLVPVCRFFRETWESSMLMMRTQAHKK